MSLILNIDTATETASICLARQGNSMAKLRNEHQQDHASWLHTAIAQMMREENVDLGDLNAIAVSAGPGSYTGLRVGMAAAKGFCYALGIPLLLEDTLMVMAFAASIQPQNKDTLLCPMIDARRMEVFTALYTFRLEEMLPSKPLILDEHSFEETLSNHRISFFGSGSKKWNSITKNANALFPDVKADAEHLSILSYKKFIKKEFADIGYCEPFYLKEFYSRFNK